MVQGEFTVTIPDNYGVYDEWDVTKIRVGHEGEIIAVEYIDSRGEKAYKITSIDNIFPK